MSALARIFHARGIKVYGIDAQDSSLIHELENEGMVIRVGEKATSFVKVCDAVVYTSAVSNENCDLLLAKKLNKPIFSRAEILGMLSKEFNTISVAGSHGKTTTTGMIANSLLQTQKEPTIHIGGILNNINSNVHLGKSKLFVTEACEYKDNFLKLKNFVSVVLNVEEDHLDYFGNINNIFKSFNKFIKNTSKNGIVVYNFDKNYKKLKIPKNAISFGLNDGADVQAKKIKNKKGKFSFNLYYLNKKYGRIYLSVYGKHNILNALATCATCIFLGLSFKEIKRGIESFQGIERRFEVLSDKKSLIFHDYAHHPQEIQSCLKTCKDINRKKKIITIFQPHTFTRTRDLYQEFLNCFSLSDEVWLLPIYPAREAPIENISSLNLSNDLAKMGKQSRYFSNFQECLLEINKNDNKDKTIALLGAGDIYDLAKMLKNQV